VPYNKVPCKPEPTNMATRRNTRNQTAITVRRSKFYYSHGHIKWNFTELFRRYYWRWSVIRQATLQTNTTWTSRFYKAYQLHTILGPDPVTNQVTGHGEYEATVWWLVGQNPCPISMSFTTDLMRTRLGSYQRFRGEKTSNPPEVWQGIT
jgi:hypothetical protein